MTERDCHNYHHHLHRQLETLVFRGQYLRWSSRIEILFGTSTKVEVNLAFTNAVIIIVITFSNHQSHVNFSNKHHHFAITIPMVTVTIFIDIIYITISILIVIWWCSGEASCKSWIKMTETLFVFSSFPPRLAPIWKMIHPVPGSTLGAPTKNGSLKLVSNYHNLQSR